MDLCQNKIVLSQSKFMAWKFGSDVLPVARSPVPEISLSSTHAGKIHVSTFCKSMNTTGFYYRKYILASSSSSNIGRILVPTSLLL